jgi:nucleoside 2-deoxyribosyltransferase
MMSIQIENGTPAPVKIYVAGPDVFSPEYAAIKQRIKALCQKAGFTALCPADDDVTPAPGQVFSEAIFEQNSQMIQQADYVMANVANFRGYEPDSGTIYECGYARGLGKKVWCYNVPYATLLEQIPQRSPGRDSEGRIIEDFGLGRNLMIAHGCSLVHGDAADCIAAIWDWHNSQAAQVGTR